MRSRISHVTRPVPYPLVFPEDGAGWRAAFTIAVASVLASLCLLGYAEWSASKPARPTIAVLLSGREQSAPDTVSDASTPLAGKLTVPRVPTAPTPTRGVDTVRQTELSRVLATAPPGVSIAVTRLDDGLYAETHAGDVFYAASLFKLAVIYEAERQRSAGELDFGTRIYPDFSEDLGTSGELPLAPDGSLAISDALYYMVTKSDNASAVGLLHVLGSGHIDETLRALGIFATSLITEELPTTAADMARLMQAIVSGEAVDDESKAHMRELLLAQTHRSGIPSLIPGATVGNKTGTWEGALHDVAFVDSPGGTYVVAILTDGTVGWQGIAEWGRRVFDVLGGQ